MMEGTLKEVIGSLSPDLERGLGDGGAAARLEKYGRNIFAPKKKALRWGIFAFLKEPMVLLLAAAAGVYFWLGETLDAAIMLVAIVPIALIDVVIGLQTEKVLEKLEKLGEPFVTVLRNGERKKINAEELVPGDVFFLEEGNVAMADAAIISSSDLSADESSLTGESEPVAKERQENFSLEFFNNRGTIFAGTTISSGKAVCMAVRTGQQTQYGKIGALLGKTKPAKTALQEQTERIVKGIGVLAVVLSILLVALELSAGENISHALIAGISLAIAAIPEEFPVVFTLFLSLGLWRLAQANALVKRLPAVETLGSVNVICTDKTGTLTSGMMMVSEVYSGEMHSAGDFLKNRGAGEFLRRALMACEKEPYDFMERAIYGYAEKAGARKKLEGWELAHEYPFDRKSKHMSHIWKSAGKEGLVLCAKGSVEGILKHCKLTVEEREWIANANEELGKRGMRVLAFASRKLRKVSGRETDESGMEFMGLVGFADPLREGVSRAVGECQDAQIRVVMLTGDHKATAQAIARQAGITDGEVREGRELDQMNEKEFIDTLRKTSIFSRVLPEHKLRIVEGLQKLGYSVAVTGDGINDAPALRKADIGIAMGERGTEVAKEAAAFVLLDDNFKTIVAAVRNGRRIYDNLQKAFGYLIAFHVPIFLSALAIPLLGLPPLLLPVHIVFLELMLHPVVSVVFERQPEEDDIMKRPPRERKAPVVGKEELLGLAAEGFVIFALAAGIYCWSFQGGAGEWGARALGFTTMVFGQLFLMASKLSKSRATWAHVLQNNFVPATFAIVGAGYLAVMYLPLLARIMKIAQLGISEWAIVLALGLAPFIFAELVKRNGLKKN